MAHLSVIVLTLNEESNIRECLEGVRWADEILVLDSGSTDRTTTIAAEVGATVHTIAWQGYGHARNIGLEKAVHDWVLWLDADERVTPALAEEIRSVVGKGDGGVAGYEVARRAYFLGKWIRHCGWYPGLVVRLFRRDRARFSETRVHEQLMVDGPLGRLRNDLLHFTDPTLDQYFRKFNTYTTLAARDMHAAGRHATMLDVIVRPPFMFVKMYLLRGGLLDGMHGFLLCAASSAYVFAKYAKLWELSRSPS